MAAPLLAVTLCLLAAGPAVAADGGDEVVISVGQSDSLGVVSTAQSDGTDTEPGPDRRLVGRESGERVDAVVIALWTIAGVMTVLLGIFLWHTSPRRRLRLAGGSAELFDEAEDDPEAAGREPGEDSGDAYSAARDFAGRVWERILAWKRSWGARPHGAGSADDGSEQESGGDSEDESAVWKFDEKDGEERSV
ncbi:MAG: hypothetical protein F4X38_00830 [Acidimicrobiaceae bacterium]|nr:hypothetical protein [Acidimicrobiaceae bacterium]